MGKGGDGGAVRQGMDLQAMTEPAPNTIQAAKLRAVSRTHGGVRLISISEQGVLFTTPARFDKRGELVASCAGRIDSHGAITWKR